MSIDANRFEELKAALRAKAAEAETRWQEYKAAEIRWEEADAAVDRARDLLEAEFRKWSAS